MKCKVEFPLLLHHFLMSANLSTCRTVCGVFASITGKYAEILRTYAASTFANSHLLGSRLHTCKTSSYFRTTLVHVESAVSLRSCQHKHDSCLAHHPQDSAGSAYKHNKLWNIVEVFCKDGRVMRSRLRSSVLRSQTLTR